MALVKDNYVLQNNAKNTKKILLALNYTQKNFFACSRIVITVIKWSSLVHFKN